MNFEIADYLNEDEIKTLINSEFPQDKADIISKNLIKYCFIQNKVCYTLTKNISYEMDESTKNTIIDKTSKLIQDSYKNLTSIQKENITLRYPKNYKNIFNNNNIESYYPQLSTKITTKNVVFNVTIGEIHFINGYVSSTTKEFKQREIGKHFITKYIKRKYEKSSLKQREEVIRPVKKIYTDKNDLDAILFYIGSSLSWKGTLDQFALFLLGLGSSGKSVIMELTKAAFDIYFTELSSDTFSSPKNIDKIFNTYKLEPQILMSWINEPADKKMDSATYKIWVDGNLQSTALYKDGLFNFTHYSRCITTANTMPYLKIESGTTRRISSMTHESHFTANKDIVDETKHIYLLDKNLISKMIEKQLLNAWFDILLDYCVRWLNNEVPIYGKNFQDTKDAIVNTCDIFQDFIDSKLTITNNEKDKIGKDEMRSAFLEMHPDRHLTVGQVMTSLKEKKISYNANLRNHTNVRGCYYGVKLSLYDNTNDKDDYENDFDLDIGIDSVDKDKEIKDLKKQNEELKNKLLKSKVKKNKAIFIKAEIEQTDEELELELLELEILGK
jgi:hypothetical protein